MCPFPPESKTPVSIDGTRCDSKEGELVRFSAGAKEQAQPELVAYRDGV